jgi:hypothetical protein
MSEETTMKLVLRYLDKQNLDRPDVGSFSVPTVNIEVSQWLNRGYVLQATHFVGMNTDGYGVLFVLVKDQPKMMKKAKDVIEE